MKIRNGFVSNSSSSSYVIVLDKWDYEKLMLQLTPLQQDMLKYVSAKGESRRFLGNEVVTIDYVDGNDDTFENYIPGSGDASYQEMRQKQMDEIQSQLLKENPDATWADVHNKLHDAHCSDENDYHHEWEQVLAKIEEFPPERVFKSSNSF